MEDTMIHDSTAKGALLMSSANISFCAMACMVKYVAFLNIYTTTLFRFMVGMGIVGLLAMSGRIKLSFINKPGLFVRGLLGGAAIAISFLSISKLGLVKAGIIIQLYPVFAVIFGWLLLRERLSRGATIAIIGAFAGACMLLVDRPHAIAMEYRIGIYEIISVFGALLGGLTVVMVKKLQATDSTPAIINPGAISLGTSMMLIAIGILATVGQLLSTDSLRYLSVATASALVMAMPLFTGIAGIVLFKERLGIAGYSGAGLLLVSTAVALYQRPGSKKGES
jgi:drug/metabolite transporter (DMT)-like permease